MMKQGKELARLKTWWPGLQQWFFWFQKGQAGSIPGTFRWRGRNLDGKLNPNTLASGLDDYPRASEPSNEERHVDLLCWMIKVNKDVYNLEISSTIIKNLWIVKRNFVASGFSASRF